MSIRRRTKSRLRSGSTGSVRNKSYKVPEVITGVRVIIDFPIAIQAPRVNQGHRSLLQCTRDKLSKLQLQRRHITRDIVDTRFLPIVDNNVVVE